MDEYEFAQRAAALPGRFADRVDEPTLKALRAMNGGGEYGELLDLLVAYLAGTEVTVTRTEYDDLAALLDYASMPTASLHKLNVTDSA